MAVNGYDEPKEEVEKFVNDKKLKHPILLMGGDVALKTFNVEAYPTNLWINQEGRIVGRELGFDPNHVAKMERRITNLIARGAKK